MNAGGADRRIPVNVLTGFLGSGKTTVLRHVLRHPSFADTAVLINEFGEVGLDHLLVGQLDNEPVLLPSGCICCTIRGDVSRAIRDLQARRQRGEVPPFRRVIVETSGLADPTPMLATIMSDLVIRHHFRLGTVAATLDGLHAEEGLQTHPELPRQAAIADRLVITKTDLAPLEQIERLRQALCSLNPAAPIVLAAGGGVDARALFGEDIQAAETRVREARRWMLAGAVADGPAGSSRHGAILSASLVLREPVVWQAFGLWLSLIAHRHGGTMLRVKGILNIIDSPTPVAVHAVQHLIHTPEHLPAWPTHERCSRLVCIGYELRQEDLQRSLEVFAQLSDCIG